MTRRRTSKSLGERLKSGQWSTRDGDFAFLVWFVFAPQCVSTIAVTRRETNGWRWPLFMIGYLFALAYIVRGQAQRIGSAVWLQGLG